MNDGGEGTPSRASADRRLIEAYLEGEEESFRAVDGWIRREIDARYASLWTEREDLCQTVHEKLLAGHRAGRFAFRSSFRTYVVSVAHHTCIDALRRRYLRRTEELPDDLPARAGNPYEALGNLEEKQILHRILQLSPEICRRLWRMIFLEKLSYREIGGRLKIPAGTVKSRMFHCRARAIALYRRIQGGSRSA